MEAKWKANVSEDGKASVAIARYMDDCLVMDRRKIEDNENAIAKSFIYRIPLKLENAGRGADS